MNTIMICCETIKHEINDAINSTGCMYPIIWVESGLHNYPQKLRNELQKILDSLKNIDRVILVFGFCGNSVEGLRTGDFEMIIPKVDDCISLLLGSLDRRKSIERTYFLTKGWLEGELNIWSEYLYTLEKYGEKRGKRIHKQILSGYKCLGILDTGAYNLEEFTDTTEHIAKELELEHKVLPASSGYIKELITGPWPKERFLKLSPNSVIELNMIIL